MRLKSGFVLRTVAGQNVVMPTGDTAKSFAGALVLNDTGALIWRMLCAGDVTTEDILSSMLNEYDVSRETARRDIEDVLSLLRENSLLEG